MRQQYSVEELPALLPVNGMDPTGKSSSTVMDCFSTSDNVQPVADDGTPGNNQAQNAQLNAVVKILGLNHIQRRALHLEITGQNYSYKQIMQAQKDMFGK